MSASQPTAKALAVLSGRFFTVGALSTLIEIAVFNALVYLLRVDPTWAKIIASLVALVNAYYGNHLWTYRGQRRNRAIREVFRFLVVNGLCAVFGATLLAVLLAVMEFHLGLTGPVWVNVANLFSIAVIVVLRFVLYTYWVFPRAAAGTATRKPVAGRARRLLSELRHQPRRFFIVAGVLTVAGIYTLVVSACGGFSDEYDNILGAWLILHRGEFPYTGFFSHHMPLAYGVGVPIVALVGNQLVLFRLLFTAMMFGWLVVIYRGAAKRIGWGYGLLLVAALTAILLPAWTNMLLAETLIAYAVVHAVVRLGLELAAPGRRPHLRDALLISVLGAIPVLSSLSYALVSLVIYLWFALLCVRAELRDGTSARALAREAARVIGILLVPYLMLAGYLAGTGSFAAFIDQAFVFNLRYYSQFTVDVSPNLAHTLVGPVVSFLGSFGGALSAVSSVWQLLFAVGLLAALLTLAVRRRFALAGFGLALVALGSYRFETPEQVFHRASSRSEVYAALVVVLCVIALSALTRGRSRALMPRAPRRPLAGALAAGCALGLLVPLVSGAGASIDLARQFRHGTLSSVQVNDSGGDQAAVVNSVVTAKDRYFVGPFDFYTQLYLNGTRSSRYTFFLPWHGSCPSCVAELDRSLRTERPLAIAWTAHKLIWGYDVDEYAPHVIRLLEDDYFTVADPRAKDVYFLTAQENVITHRLEAAGFDATVRPARP